MTDSMHDALNMLNMKRPQKSNSWLEFNPMLELRMANYLKN